MVCFYPKNAWRSRHVNPTTGKRGIVFNSREGFSDLPLTLPCRQCVGCRLEYSRQWAIRMMHEASMHEDNCFITLTYDDENLPNPPSLNVRDYQLFMKRFRKKYGQNIKFYHCGEYGDQYGRPHYHAAIFNFDFPDKTTWKKTAQGEMLYRSESLELLWPVGHISIGALTFSSAAYIARYVMKKITGEIAQSHYEYTDEYGEITQLKPEYTTQSNGIGKGWIASFNSDIYPTDFVIIDGRKMRPPKYYDNQYEITDAKGMAKIKAGRRRKLKKHDANNSRDRLKVREKIQLKRLDQLKRNHDSNGE